MDPSAPFSTGTPQLALVHLGEAWYDYILDCVGQALDMNGELELWLVAAERHRPLFLDPKWGRVRFVPVESLPPSREHAQFRDKTKLDRKFWGGFWKFATERFFILEELMRAYGLGHCFHCENDNLLYVPLKGLLPGFVRHYPGLAVTMDNDERCIPGFMYFGSREASRGLAEYLARESAKSAANDMETLAAYYRQGDRRNIDSLPIVPAGHPGPWVTPSGKRSRHPDIYLNHAADFGVVFDAAALGQYLGGIDPRIAPGKDTLGFINESCVFSPADYEYRWREEPGLGRVPSMGRGDSWTRINNLHIHSKNLKAFRSRP